MSAQNNSGPKKGRRSHLSDFQQTVGGEYIYRGSHRVFTGSQQQRKALLTRVTCLAIIMLTCSVVCGCIGVPGSINCFYVILPYAATLLSTVTMVWGLVKLIRGGDPLREYIYTASVQKFSLRGIVTMVLAALAIVCEVLYVTLNGTEGLTAGFVVFLLFHAVIFAGAFLWRCWIRPQLWRGEDEKQ